MMDKLIARFSEQLTESLAIGRKANINAHSHPINKVYVAGLGGSGIGADFVSGFIKDEAGIPYLVGKSYDIPNYIDQNTLAIVSSYSGNTEETLSSFELLKKTGAKIVCISSGGKLIKMAVELGLDYIKIPDDWPSPRACLGYSMVQQLFILHKLGLISDRLILQIESSVSLIEQESDAIKALAKSTAKILTGKIPIIYVTDRMPAAAVRLRQQLNENSKILCWHHVIPEMNHNELVGWRDKNENLAVIYLRSKDDFARNQTRIEINKQIISKYTSTIIELFAKGKNLVEQTIYLVHLGDWISWYLSQNRHMDAIEVNVIDFLKKELSKI